MEGYEEDEMSLSLFTKTLPETPCATVDTHAGDSPVETPEHRDADWSCCEFEKSGEGRMCGRAIPHALGFAY